MITDRFDYLARCFRNQRDAEPHIHQGARWEKPNLLLFNGATWHPIMALKDIHYPKFGAGAVTEPESTGTGGETVGHPIPVTARAEP